MRFPFCSSVPGAAPLHQLCEPGAATPLVLELTLPLLLGFEAPSFRLGASLSLLRAGCECGSLGWSSSRKTAEPGLRCELKPHVKLIVKINPSNYFIIV